MFEIENLCIAVLRRNKHLQLSIGNSRVSGLIPPCPHHYWQLQEPSFIHIIILIMASFYDDVGDDVQGAGGRFHQWEAQVIARPWEPHRVCYVRDPLTTIMIVIIMMTMMMMKDHKFIDGHLKKRMVTILMKLRLADNDENNC